MSALPLQLRDKVLEAMARAHDQEEAAQKGEPSPWEVDEITRDAGFEEFRQERLAAMRCAYEALLKADPL